MLVYIGETITVQVRGQTWREEKCEHCNRVFHYQMRITATGAATNPYFLDSYGSPRRAEADAKARLDHALKHNVFAVPCPHCLLYQEYMVPAIRADRLRWMRSAGRFLLALGGLILFFSASIIATIVIPAKESNPKAMAVVAGLPVLPLSAGIGLILLRRRRLAAYDPNAEGYIDDRRELAAEYALKPEEFARLRVPSLPPGLAQLGTPPPRSEQLVGKNCIRCGERVSGELDSRFCRECGWPVHDRCAVPAEGGCPLCGAGVLPVNRTVT